MTTTEPSAATSISSALDSVGRAMHWLDLEMAWIEGLRQCKHPTDRDRIMAAAGRRLRVFDEVLDDRLRLTWLSDVASEVRSRGDQPLGDKLGALAIAELREASARMRLDLEALRKSAAAGESVREWAWNNVAAANRIRDLGRTAKNLNGTGLLALVDSQDADLAIRLADAMASGARLVAAVPEPLRIDRNDLIAWAKRPEAASRLPVLLRRLISETTDVERIDFPSGSAVATRGWDGIVNSIGGNQYVPAGESCWEVSAQQSGSDRKARDDYRKRTERLSREQRRGLSYVAVICAPWTKKRDFAPEMRARRDFRDVHALNVDDLEAWLECAPQTTVWLRELMGEPVAGIRSLSSWWTQWLESTNPALDAGVVLAGRDNQAAKLRDRCGLTRGGVITVGGQVHRDEIIAFVSAALVSTKGSDSSRADVLYVDDPNSAERLLTTAAASASSPLRRPLTVLVPSADFAQCVPPGSRCHVIVPVPGAATAEILLVPVDNEPAARVFEEIGADGNTAHRWGSLARMSLMTLRRELATSPELHRPQWASGHVGHALRRGLLLGGWDDNRAGDRQVVEELLGHSYDDATEALRGLDPGDAPMLQTGDVWHTVSPADAWVLLNGHITGDEVDAFGKIAHRVLTEPHPSYGMTASEAFRAACEGMVGRYSPAIKRGIATTVALLGSRPPELPGAATPATSAAAGIVWSILRSANNDPTPRTWHAAADALPLLAEAEPDAVLQSLRSCLSDAHPFAREMFADGRSDEVSVPGPSPHLRVLDALETAAWSPDHMPASVDLLARLAGVDPGGPWSKRLAGSLASIMCPWLPYTSADADARLRTIRSLRRNHPDVAWRLMLSMLPDGHDFQVPGGRPRYRDWKQSEHAVTLREHTQVVASITEMLLEDMGENPDRWVDMIGEIDSLPEETRRRVLAGLNHLADAQPDEEFKSTVWPKLHYLVTHHRRFNDAVWALPEAEIAHCEVLLDLLRPADHAVGYGWLFSADPMVVDGVSAAEGQDTFQAALAPRQSEAVSTVLASGGLEAVWDFAAQVEQPWRVGRSLADGDPALDLAVLAAMDGAPEAVTQVALGYFSRRFSALGWEGLRRLIDAHNRSPQVVADLYRAPRAYRAALEAGRRPRQRSRRAILEPRRVPRTRNSRGSVRPARGISPSTRGGAPWPGPPSAVCTTCGAWVRAGVRRRGRRLP